MRIIHSVYFLNQQKDICLGTSSIPCGKFLNLCKKTPDRVLNFARGSQNVCRIENIHRKWYYLRNMCLIFYSGDGVIRREVSQSSS